MYEVKIYMRSLSLEGVMLRFCCLFNNRITPCFLIIYCNYLYSFCEHKLFPSLVLKSFELRAFVYES